MKEYDIVSLKSDFKELLAGTTGTIVHEHVKGEVFIVEFFDVNGDTIAIEDVDSGDLRLVDAFGGS